MTLKFRVPPAGSYTLHEACVSDYWLGCDRRVTLKLKVARLARAEQERRMAAELAAVAPTTEEDSEGGSEGDEDGEGKAEEEEEEELEDLTESGTEESDSEEETDGGAKGAAVPVPATPSEVD